MAGEFREHPVDHGLAVEVRCRCWRFYPAGCTGGMTDRVEQRKPEKLGVLLVALDLHDGEPMRLTPTVSESAPQRRLPAAGRLSEDRHLPRRPAIQSATKLIPADP